MEDRVMTPAQKKRYLAKTKRPDPPAGMMFNPWGNEPRFVTIESVERKSRERMADHDVAIRQGLDDWKVA
jgi:hypothetical protein